MKSYAAGEYAGLLGASSKSEEEETDSDDEDWEDEAAFASARKAPPGTLPTVTSPFMNAMMDGFGPSVRPARARALRVSHWCCNPLLSY